MNTICSMKCDAPASRSLSYLEPTSRKNPRLTDWTWGSLTVRMRRPLASVVISYIYWLLSCSRMVCALSVAVGLVPVSNSWNFSKARIASSMRFSSAYTVPAP